MERENHTIKKGLVTEAQRAGLASRCDCNWGMDCLRVQLHFYRINDPEFGRKCITFEVKGSRSKWAPWRMGLAVNLLHDHADQFDTKSTVSVAPHHFWRGLVRLHLEGKSYLSTPRSEEDILEHTEGLIDTRFAVYNARMKKDLYFAVPNHPKERVFALIREYYYEQEALNNTPLLTLTQTDDNTSKNEKGAVNGSKKPTSDCSQKRSYTSRQIEMIASESDEYSSSDCYSDDKDGNQMNENGKSKRLSSHRKGSKSSCRSCSYWKLGKSRRKKLRFEFDMLSFQQWKTATERIQTLETEMIMISLQLRRAEQALRKENEKLDKTNALLQRGLQVEQLEQSDNWGVETGFQTPERVEDEEKSMSMKV